MMNVWTDAAEAGVLDRFGAGGSTFVYQPGVSPMRAVSPGTGYTPTVGIR